MRVFRKFFGMLVVVLGLALGLAGLKEFMPDYHSRFLIATNLPFGTTDKAELKRREKIVLLPISNEKKNILIEHKIFEGATAHMVELALGTPRESYPNREQNGVTYSYWKYHFKDDNRPTMLIFQNGRLAGAQKIPSRTASIQ